MVTAQFGTKKFYVNENKIYTPNGTAISEALNIEETEVKGKKPKVKIKGIKLQTVSFELVLDSRFVTVDSELRWWKKTLLAKKTHFFILGKYKVGRFYLSQYDVSNVEIVTDGKYSQAKLSITLTEDGSYARKHTINFSKAKTVKSSSSSKKNKIKVRVGSTVKPKSGTRLYGTASNALNKKGSSSKAPITNYKVTATYKSKTAIKIKASKVGWVRAENLKVVKY